MPHYLLQLTYQDAAERIWHFHIYYAIATRHEDRQYLDCWCEETEGNLALPELQQNWSLRLERIAEAAIITPIKGKWRNLDYIEVEMHLLRNLAFTYRSKTTQDIINELLPNSPSIRRVVRKVTNTFWSMREVLRYGKDCIIVSPESVRNKLKEEVRLMYQ